MRVLLRARATGVLVASAVIAGACAGGVGAGPQSGADDAQELAAETPTTQPVASSSTSEGAKPPVAPERDEPPDRWMENLAAAPPTASGWPLEPGEWASNAFTHPIIFDMPSGLAVNDHGPWSIRLKADRPGTIGQIHLVRSSTLTLSNGSSVPVPRSIEEASELIESVGTSTLLDHGTIERPDGVVGWWKLEVDADIPATPCLLGDTCVMLAAATGGDPVDIVTGEPLVIYRYFGDETGRFAAYVTGPPGELDSLVEATEHIMTSFTQLVDSEAEPPPSDGRFVSSVGTATARFEPSTYRRMFGQTQVAFQLDDPIDGLFARISEPEMLILSIDKSDMAIISYEPGVVDPSISQSSGVTPEARAVFLSNNPLRSIEEWSAYVDQLGVLTATGSSEVGGEQVPWFEWAVEPGTGFPCWPGYDGTECIEFLLRWPHSDVESTNRHFVFGDEGLLVVVYPDPDLAIDEVMATWQPLLDTLSISRPG